jgi:hypothetical protein
MTAPERFADSPIPLAPRAPSIRFSAAWQRGHLPRERSRLSGYAAQLLADYPEATRLLVAFT